MIHRIFAIALLVFSQALVTGCILKKDLGSKDNPIKISLVPGQSAQVLMDNSQPLRDWLKKETGFEFQISVAPNYVAVIESLASQRSDFAILSTFAYLLAQEKYEAKALLTITNLGQTTYKSAIIARADGPKTIRDLNGKKFAFVDPLSSSGYVLPASLFKEKNIVPKEFVFAGRHDAVVSMVYQGQVDAGAVYYIPPEGGEPKDARFLVKTQYPDVFQKIKIIELTGDLPNEAFVARKELSPGLQENIANSLIRWVNTDSGKKTLKALYNGDGFKRVDPAAYASARKMLQTIGKRPEDLLKK